MKKISVVNKKLTFGSFAVAAILTASSFSSIAHANVNTGTGNYVGIDAVYSSMKFKKDYGDNIFSKKMIPGINIFAGHMVNETFGAEIGYEVAKKMKRTETVNAGATVAGIFIDPTGARFMSYNTFFKQHHAYLGAVAKKAIFNDNTLIGLMLGVSVSHIQARYNVFADNFGPRNDTRTFSKTKPISLVRASIEYKFTDKLGLRGLATWKNTSQFKIKSEENSSSNAEIKLKDTFNLGLGISYYM